MKDSNRGSAQVIPLLNASFLGATANRFWISQCQHFHENAMREVRLKTGITVLFFNWSATPKSMRSLQKASSIPELYNLYNREEFSPTYQKLILPTEGASVSL